MQSSWKPAVLVIKTSSSFSYSSCRQDDLSDRANVSATKGIHTLSKTSLILGFRKADAEITNKANCTILNVFHSKQTLRNDSRREQGVEEQTGHCTHLHVTVSG